MTALHTRPIPRPVSPAEPLHEHGWRVDSRHSSSEGVIVYVRCAECGAHRVDLQPHPDIPPAALSVALPRSPAHEARGSIRR